jgi:hypothetical protein
MGMRPASMTAMIDGKRYSTDAGALIASDVYWDGRAWERSGHNTFLFRTPRGAYFAQHQSFWQDQRDTLKPLSPEEAIALYECLPQKAMNIPDAFPGVSG